jgi:hypothetical protein
LQFYQPGFTLIAAGIYKPEEVYKRQKDYVPDNVKWVKDVTIGLDPVAQKITTAKNGVIGYDYLVLAPGLQINFDLVDGISRKSLGEGDAHCIYDFNGAQKAREGMQKFGAKGGKAVFTDTYTKHKCGGVPKKMTLLTEHYTRKHDTRKNCVFDFFTASKQLYDVPYFTPRLEEIYKERNINIHLQHRLTAIDTVAHKVYFDEIKKVEKEVIDPDNSSVTKTEVTLKNPVEMDYDFLHFTPPMSAPDFVRDSGLGWQEGKLAAESWVEVDKETLIHTRFPNIISLGDVAGIPTSKTSAAIRVQVPIAVKNLLSVMEGKTPVEKYNGYAACPIVTGYGELLLCEFDYNKEAKPSIPFLDTSKEQYVAWLLKVYVLKPLYFYGMLNGWA